MKAQCAFGLVVAVLIGQSGAEVVVVHPGPGTPVQDAIDSAGIGDELVLMPGVYNESIDFRGKAITVRSEGGAAATTITSGGAGPVVRFVSAETPSSILEGITLRDGAGEARGHLRLGGGAYVEGAAPTIIECIFAHNRATLGGGMACLNGAAPLVLECLFVGNEAAQGAAIHARDASPAVVGCAFAANSAEFRGGAMLLDGTASVQVVNAMVTGSNAQKLDGGGIACLADAALTIVNAALTGNRAEDRGGALYAFHKSRPILAHATFVGNAASQGGAILADPLVQTTVSNSAFSGTNPVVGQQLTVQYSCIQSGWSGAGMGNVVAPPRLLDADGPDNILGTLDDDVRLAPGSPCIDRASGIAIPADVLDVDNDGDTNDRVSIDLGGGPRAVDAQNYADGGIPASNQAVPDMGAFEAPADLAVPCPCDVDGITGADVADLLVYLTLWFDGDDAAELTGDVPTAINVFDLLAFLDCFFAGCPG